MTDSTPQRTSQPARLVWRAMSTEGLTSSKPPANWDMGRGKHPEQARVRVVPIATRGPDRASDVHCRVEARSAWHPPSSCPTVSIPSVISPTVASGVAMAASSEDEQPWARDLARNRLAVADGEEAVAAAVQDQLALGLALTATLVGLQGLVDPPHQSSQLWIGDRDDMTLHGTPNLGLVSTITERPALTASGAFLLVPEDLVVGSFVRGWIGKQF